MYPYAPIFNLYLHLIHKLRREPEAQDFILCWIIFCNGRSINHIKIYHTFHKHHLSIAPLWAPHKLPETERIKRRPFAA